MSRYVAISSAPISLRHEASLQCSVHAGPQPSMLSGLHGADCSIPSRLATDYFMHARGRCMANH